jgi:hypothetical protein
MFSETPAAHDEVSPPVNAEQIATAAAEFAALLPFDDRFTFASTHLAISWLSAAKALVKAPSQSSSPGGAGSAIGQMLGRAMS